MTLIEAADLARSLIREHDLRGFEFGWVEEYPQFLRLRARPRSTILAGACLLQTGRILLSRLEVTFSPETVLDTILHEIAPLDLPATEVPPLFSDAEIDAALAVVDFKPLSYGWLSGTFNTPRLSEAEERALDKALVRRFLEGGDLADLFGVMGLSGSDHCPRP